MNVMLHTTCSNLNGNVYPNKKLHIEYLLKEFKSLDCKWKRLMFFSRLSTEDSEMLQQMLKEKI